MATTSGLSEAKLRSYLAVNLDLIEPGLSLLEEEHRVKNEHGADGSIDILARDGSGDLVIIELKRSDQTARQALHELEKYVALLAADRGVRLDRLRGILLSTEWHEILVPFTRLVGHADFFVVGRRLLLGADGTPAGSEEVELPVLDKGLEACPLHLHLLFADKGQRDAASISIVKTLHAVSVEDFITFDVDFVDNDDRVIFPYGTSLVLAVFPDALRDRVRALYPEHCEDEPGDSWWHEQVVQLAVVGDASADEVSVRTPSDDPSFSGWSVDHLAGHGRYSNTTVWTEAELQRVVRADGEAFSSSFQRVVAVANKPAWTRMRHNVAEALRGSGAWPETVDALLDELELRPNAQVSVRVYAPADILLGLEAIIRLRSAEYLPAVEIEWSDGNLHGFIGGRLAWDTRTRVRSLDQTVGVVFDEFFDYIAASSTGAIREHEVKLTALHGLRYDIVDYVERADGSLAQDLSRVELIAGQLTREPFTLDRDDVGEFINAHDGYLTMLAAAFEANILRR